MTIWRVIIACWISTAADTHLEYGILIVFPLQQWLHKSASVLLAPCIACLVFLRSYSFMYAILLVLLITIKLRAFFLNSKYLF